MVSLKDIYDLLSGLITRIKDRQIAAELREIQTLVLSVQSAHFDTRERNIELLAENARLKQENADLVMRHAQEMARMTQKHADAIARFQKAAEYKAEETVVSGEEGRSPNPERF